VSIGSLTLFRSVAWYCFISAFFRALLTTNSASALANNKQVSRCSSLGTWIAFYILFFRFTTVFWLLRVPILSSFISCADFYTSSWR